MLDFKEEKYTLTSYGKSFALEACNEVKIEARIVKKKVEVKVAEKAKKEDKTEKKDKPKKGKKKEGEEE